MLRATVLGLLLILFISSAVFADGVPVTDHGPDGAPVGSDGPHPDADATEMKQKELDKLVEYSGQDDDSVMKHVFNTKFPDAVTLSLGGNDAELSFQSNKFLGYLNESQVRSMKDDAQKVVDTEKVKSTDAVGDEKRDDRYVRFMQGLLWAAKSKLNEGPSTPEEEKFQALSKKDAEKVEEDKKTLFEKINLAADGDKQAKQWLDDNITKKSLVSFLRNQQRTGTANDKLIAAKVLKGMSKKEQGKDVADLVKGDKNVRFWLPSSTKDVASMLAQADKAGVLNGAKFTGKKAAVPDGNWKFAEGKLAKGLPSGVIDPAQVQKEKLEKATTLAASNKSSNAAVKDLEDLRSFVSTNCTSCHSAISVVGSNIKDAQIQKGEKTMSLSNALHAVNTNEEMMSIDQAQKDALSAFASKQ